MNSTCEEQYSSKKERSIYSIGVSVCDVKHGLFEIKLLVAVSPEGKTGHMTYCILRLREQKEKRGRGLCLPFIVLAGLMNTFFYYNPFDNIL